MEFGPQIMDVNFELVTVEAATSFLEVKEYTRQWETKLHE